MDLDQMRRIMDPHAFQLVEAEIRKRDDEIAQLRQEATRREAETSKAQRAEKTPGRS